jgi:hypothetical protein
VGIKSGTFKKKILTPYKICEQVEVTVMVSEIKNKELKGKWQ